MSRPIADDPPPGTLRKRRQRERDRSEARAAKLAEDIAEAKHVASLPPKRVETSVTIKNSTLHVSTHYTPTPTMTVPEEKANGHASKPPRVSKYITIEISPPALDAMVERRFLAAGKETDDAAIRRAVFAMFNAAWMNTAPTQKDCLPAPEGVADPAACGDT